MADVVEQAYEAKPQAVFSAVEHAVARLGYKVQAVDRGQQSLAFKTGMSMKTWSGQRMEARVIGRANGSSALVLSRQSSGQLYDWGEKREVTAQFFDAVTAALSELAVSATDASPDSSSPDVVAPKTPEPLTESSAAASSTSVLGANAEKRFGTRAVEKLEESEEVSEKARPVAASSRLRGQQFRQQSAKAARTTFQVARRINWSALFSFRFLMACFLMALIPTFLVSLIAPILGTVVFFLAFGLLVIIGALNPNLVLYCPYCQKRVKMGATTCHHCGRAVAGFG